LTGSVAVPFVDNFVALLLGGVVVRALALDQEIAGLTPGRCIAG